MSYVVLARKWRPRRFEDVVGQEHITNTLANAISQGRVAHGYLFCGPRGVGKTTTARILAKALNCVHGPTPTPCNECTACLDVDLGRSMDIIEVDGASTRGIDDVRELRENVRYAPTSGRTKVYIIDEVHMLTREAFNALLKTLEEPPPHVVFVMATTEPFKVPPTILSRCQRFDFARIHPRAVVDRLAFIVESEGFSVQRDALALLARRSAGGLRDALSTLDQVLASAEGEITAEMVTRVLGLLGSDFYFDLTDRLLSGDARGALRLLDDVYHAGADLGELAEELAGHLRNVMLLTVGPEMESVLAELGPAEVARLKDQAGRTSAVTAARLLEVALRTLTLARRSEHLRLHIEMAFVEMAELSGAVSLGEVARRLEEIEGRLGGGAGAGGAGGSGGTGGSERKSAPAAPRKAAAPEAPPAPSKPRADAAGEAMSEAAASGAPAPGDPAALWDDVIAAVKKRKIAIGAFLHGSRVAAVDPAGRLVIQVDAEHPFYKQNLEEVGNRKVIEEVIRQVIGRNLSYSVVTGDVDVQSANAGAGEPGASSGEAGAREGRRTRTPHEIAESDPRVHRIIELFDGEVTS